MANSGESQPQMFARTSAVVAAKPSLERATRIELAFSAWEAHGMQ